MRFRLRVLTVAEQAPELRNPSSGAAGNDLRGCGTLGSEAREGVGWPGVGAPRWGATQAEKASQIQHVEPDSRRRIGSLELRARCSSVDA